MNRRYELKAYTEPNPCRLAAILVGMLPEAMHGIDRDILKRYWAQLYPRHKVQTGKKNISARVGEALSCLKVAGIVTIKGDLVVVRNVQRLKMSASNLEIIQDARGYPIRPGLWRQRPTAPSHLLATQIALETRPPQRQPD